MTSKFSLAMEHDGKNVAVSIEMDIESEVLMGDDVAVRKLWTPESPEIVIDRLASAAKLALGAS